MLKTYGIRIMKENPKKNRLNSWYYIDRFNTSKELDHFSDNVVESVISQRLEEKDSLPDKDGVVFSGVETVDVVKFGEGRFWKGEKKIPAHLDQEKSQEKNLEEGF